MNTATCEVNYCRRMRQLLQSFPSLMDAPTTVYGSERFDSRTAVELDRWACSGIPGSGALNAARFVLAVWNPLTTWECGQFNLHVALQCWDEAHREAFLTWVAAPWWP